jgi:exodeoxyribonuclease VII small subunit
MSNQKLNFTQSMKRIEEINEWFENEDLDLEEALTQLKEGKQLIKSCQDRLKTIENEFEELKIDFEEETDEPDLDTEASEGVVFEKDDDKDMPF